MEKEELVRVGTVEKGARPGIVKTRFDEGKASARGGKGGSGQTGEKGHVW